jgi:hypothetical protein
MNILESLNEDDLITAENVEVISSLNSSNNWGV